MDPTNTPRVFHVETTRRFNVEYTWSVCRGVFDHYPRKIPVKDFSFTKFVNSKFYKKSYNDYNGYNLSNSWFTEQLPVPAS